MKCTAWQVLPHRGVAEIHIMGEDFTVEQMIQFLAQFGYAPYLFRQIGVGSWKLLTTNPIDQAYFPDARWWDQDGQPQL
jgi:hypothetical protein